MDERRRPIPDQLTALTMATDGEEHFWCDRLGSRIFWLSRRRHLRHVLERCNRLTSAEIAAALSSKHVNSPLRCGMEKLNLDFSPGSWMVAAAAWRESDRSEWPFAAALGLPRLSAFERSTNP